MKVVHEDKQYYFNSLIEYFENSMPKEINNTYRDKVIMGFLSKYIKTLKAITVLDNLGYFEECDILVRSLYEIVVEISYLELNPSENYERLELYNYYEDKKRIEELSNRYDTDKNTIPNITEVYKMAKKYTEKNYSGSNNRWNGMSIKDTAKEVDKMWKKNGIKISLEELYLIIYKICCLFSHNSVKILASNYVSITDKGLEYNIDAIPQYDYLYNCNNVILISNALVNVCLVSLFSNKTDLFDEFNELMGNYI